MWKLSSRTNYQFLVRKSLKTAPKKRATQQLNEQELEHLITQMVQANERAQYSKTEQSVLQDLLNSIIEKRDQTVAQHTAAVGR